MRRTSIRSLAWSAGAVLGSLVLAGAATWSGPKATEPPDRAAAEVRAVALSELPPEVRQTMQLVRQGGPFPYRKDGTVFFNRERLLPAKARGHYREYTVPTPGEGDRGARRLVCGGEPVTSPEVCYYTADHYRSFKRLQP